MSRITKSNETKWNQLRSISPKIKNLQKLQVFIADYNKIAKINHLDTITSLTHINLFSNLISKIERLYKLSQLIDLDLGRNQVSKIEGLEKLSQLKNLYLGGNQISKIEGLEKLSQLNCLDLIKNNISSINNKGQFLHTLKKLWFIDRKHPTNSVLSDSLRWFTFE